VPVTIVVGGQYGSEGKGKVVALLADRLSEPWIVRCGGPNSGHSVTIGGKTVVLRQVPSCATPQRAIFCLSAGCVVDEGVLFRELDLLEVDRDRIFVDPRAVIVTDEDREQERTSLSGIASTCSGTGAALIRRMSRASRTFLAEQSATLGSRCRIEPVAPLLHSVHDAGREIIIEGTQGFALSLLHGPDYPYVTSRDTTAAGFAMEAGLSPRLIDRIVMVIRTFPIRVGGPSGPFADELSWETVASIGNAPQVIPEYTSVTHRLRRVAQFNTDAVRLAASYNRPTSLAVMGIDRLDYENTGATKMEELTVVAGKFLNGIQVATQTPIEFIGTGFGTFDVIQAESVTAILPKLANLAYA